jgi:hypothetical protein
MEFVSFGQYWLTPSAKKKSLFNPFDSPGLSDLFAAGVNHKPAGHCFHF